MPSVYYLTGLPYQLCEAGSRIFVLQIRKLRLTEGKSLIKGLTSRTFEKLNPVSGINYPAGTLPSVPGDTCSVKSVSPTGADREGGVPSG